MMKTSNDRFSTDFLLHLTRVWSAILAKILLWNGQMLPNHGIFMRSSHSEHSIIVDSHPSTRHLVPNQNWTRSATVHTLSQYSPTRHTRCLSFLPSINVIHYTNLNRRSFHMFWNSPKICISLCKLIKSILYPYLFDQTRLSESILRHDR